MSLVAPLDLIRVRRYEESQIIYMRGKVVSVRQIDRNSYWQIESGILRTYDYLDDGSMSVFGLWGKGDILSPRLWQDVNIECIANVAINHLPYQQQPEIYQYLIRQNLALQELMMIKQYRPVDVAVLKFLIWLGRKFGTETEKEILVDVWLTHQQIAECLGITRVTVTRVLNYFEQKGKINRISKDLIEIIK